ncbi:hypothetical protein GW17_00019748 [Ensete ventricosum]|nr:hypothetical protein GW17_00019748 [Ensete ventricosum]
MSNTDTPGRLQSDASDSLETVPDAVPTVFTEPPIEEQLLWHTLWPELPSGNLDTELDWGDNLDSGWNCTKNPVLHVDLALD